MRRKGIRDSPQLLLSVNEFLNEAKRDITRLPHKESERSDLPSGDRKTHLRCVFSALSRRTRNTRCDLLSLSSSRWRENTRKTANFAIRRARSVCKIGMFPDKAKGATRANRLVFLIDFSIYNIFFISWYTICDIWNIIYQDISYLDMKYYIISSYILIFYYIGTRFILNLSRMNFFLYIIIKGNYCTDRQIR